ncbi:hypothetical protein MtrunA17_Chr3g0137001 [Medicago truncatula]|uniref:Uncharacterized protein n=1 Tax=Medicago truncatula TaxID=3880 RepID=A0A396J2F3_MEDTR|nr:hypothetical protein MtrunA17_Chr3g0137001 [Medicago truncatula]
MQDHRYSLLQQVLLQIPISCSAGISNGYFTIDDGIITPCMFLLCLNNVHLLHTPVASS